MQPSFTCQPGSDPQETSRNLEEGRLHVESGKSLASSALQNEYRPRQLKVRATEGWEIWIDVPNVDGKTGLRQNRP